jgi:hypothetical protein
MPNNPYDFSRFEGEIEPKPVMREFTDIDRELLTNDLIDKTLAELKLMDKENRIRKAIYKAIHNHSEQANTYRLGIEDMDLFIDSLAIDIAQVV